MSRNTSHTGDKEPPTAVTPTIKMRVQNQHVLQATEQGKRERMLHPDQLVSIMCEYMTVIETHNKSLHKTPNQQWKGWLEAGLNAPRISVQKMDTIVKYRKNGRKHLS